MEKDQARKLLEELAMEEEAENHLIWLYKTLLDMGIENCLEGDQQEVFRKGMSVLYEESRIHKEIVAKIIDKY